MIRHQEETMLKLRSNGTATPILVIFAIGFGCVPLTNSHAQMAPRKAEPNTLLISRVHRRKANARLQALWQQRGQKEVARYIVPFANDSEFDVKYTAIKMLGRLEDPIALPTLQKLDSRPMTRFPLDLSHTGGLATYPLLPFAVGRIKARNLTGKRKIEVAIKELGLDFPALARLSRRINSDQYGHFMVGYPLLREIVDILYQQKRRGIAVDAVARALSLKPVHNALISVASLPPQQQAKKLLGYVAQAGVKGGDEVDIIKYWEDLGPAGRSVALPFVRRILQRPPREVSTWNMIPILESLARSGDTGAVALLKRLTLNRKQYISVLAERALENLK
jgi:hypothetical protein